MQLPPQKAQHFLMRKFTSLSRIAAAAVLVASTAAFALSAPANAATVAPADSTITASMVDNGDGTMTLTYSGVSTTASPQQALTLIFLASGSTCDENYGVSLASAAKPPYLVRDNYKNNLPDSPAVIGAGISVGRYTDEPPFRTDTTLAQGTYEACLYFSNTSGGQDLQQQLAVVLIPPLPPVYASGTMSSNPDGTLSLTYADVNEDDGRSLDLVLLPGVTTCPSDVADAYGATGVKYVISSNSGGGLFVTLTASPMVIGAGTNAGIVVTGAPPVLGNILTGSYQACLYFDNDGTGVALQQSLPASLVPVVEPEPVSPAFTG